MHRAGCGAHLGLGVRCGYGPALCHQCFHESFPEAVELPDRPEPTSLEKAIVEELSRWAPRLAGLGHAHVRMDANARHLVAQIAIAVMEKNA